MMRGTPAALGMWVALAAPGAALAQGKPLPPPSTDASPPVEMTIAMEDDRPVCAPAELRLPANTNVALHVVNHADRAVTITMPGQFSNGRVLHADGDLVHVASEEGYLAKQNGQGTLRLRTQDAGRRDYACTVTTNRQAPFKGTVVLTPPNG